MLGKTTSNHFISLFAGLSLFSVSAAPANSAPVKLTEGEVPYSVADKMWDLTLGQHRARIHVSAAAPAVWAHLPWRLQMKGMETHQVIVVDAATGKRVQNIVRAAADSIAGDIVFQPAAAPGDYYVYYLPLRPHGNLNDMSGYVSYKCGAEPAWLQESGLTPDALAKGEWRGLPTAKVLEFQARSEFDRFDPMEVIASPDEANQLLSQSPQPLLLFPEDRRHTIRMQADLPLRWVLSGPSAEFAGEAQRNEYYAFQIGLFAPKQPANNVVVSFSPLRAADGREIPASALTSFNTGGRQLGQALHQSGQCSRWPCPGFVAGGRCRRKPGPRNLRRRRNRAGRWHRCPNCRPPSQCPAGRHPGTRR